MQTYNRIKTHPIYNLRGFKGKSQLIILITILLLTSSSYNVSKTKFEEPSKYPEPGFSGTIPEKIKTVHYNPPPYSDLKLNLPPLPSKEALDNILNSQCSRALEHLEKITPHVSQLEGSNIVKAVSSYFGHKKIYKEWIDHCLDGYGPSEISILEDRKSLLKYNIEVLLNKTVFGGLVTRLEHIVKMIDAPKDIKSSEQLEVKFSKGIQIFNKLSNDLFQLLIQSKNALVEEYSLQSAEDTIREEESFIDENRYNLAYNHIRTFIYSVSKFDSYLFLQLNTYLFDAEFLTVITDGTKNLRAEKDIKIIVRDVFEDTYVNNFLEYFVTLTCSKLNFYALENILGHLHFIDMKKETHSKYILIKEKNKSIEGIQPAMEEMAKRFNISEYSYNNN